MSHRFSKGVAKMLRNVEIKAKVRDLSDIISKAKSLSGNGGELIPQHDVFYNATNGRLKLRKFSDGSSCLLFYSRPDTEGPKLSEYEKCELKADEQGIATGKQIDSILTRSLGIKGELKKVRHLFMVGQTRVHIDKVEGLGDFMELEVVLTPQQTLEEGLLIAENLMNELGVAREDLLSGAYIDIVLNKK